MYINKVGEVENKMQEVVTFEEILKMHPLKLASEGEENTGKILYALVQEILKLRTELEESNDLGLDLKMVHEIVEELMKEGKVE